MKYCCRFLFWIGKFPQRILRQVLLLEKQLLVTNCRDGLVLCFPFLLIVTTVQRSSPPSAAVSYCKMMVYHAPVVYQV